MQITYDAYSLFPLLALIISSILIFRAWKYRTRRIALTFMVLMAALAWWSAAAFMERNVLDLSAKIFWMKMTYPGVLCLPLTWLVFTRQYTDKEQWITRRKLIMLSILPLITLILVVTDSWHHLMWKDIWLDIRVYPPVDNVTHNTWFWINAAYSYTLILFGNIWLIRTFWRSAGLYRKQVGIMLAGALIPILGNLLFISGINPFSGVDPTPLAFALTSIAFFWGLSRLQLLDILPIAHEEVLKSMVEGVIILDSRQRVVDINPSAENILVRKRSLIIGRTFSQVLPGQADLLDLKTESLRAQTEFTVGEGPDLKCYAVYISTVVARRGLSGYLVLLHDDTQRKKAESEAREKAVLETELNERRRSEEVLKKSEARFRNLVENAAVGIITSLPGGRLLSINKAALQIFGYDSLHLSHMPVISTEEIYVNTEDRRRLLQMVERKRVVKGFEVQMKRRDSTPFWASVNMIILNSESAETQLLSIIEDITERKLAADELSRLNAKLKNFNLQLENKVEERTRQLEQAAVEAKASNHAKSEFLASMSHELRTPLNAIIGFSQVLQAEYFGSLQAKQAEYVCDILESGKHLLSLINDILDISKVEAGKMELEPSPVKIKDIIHNSLTMIKEKAQVHKIKLGIQISGDIENLEIMADERRIKQVLFNLLSNAVKFTPDGGGIEVNAKIQGNELVICVSDNGIGITSAEQRDLFQPFYQASGGIQGKTPGTGLGLSITKSIVEKHGGRIWMQSDGLNKGSCFTFTLPIQPTSIPPSSLFMEDTCKAGRNPPYFEG